MVREKVQPRISIPASRSLMFLKARFDRKLAVLRNKRTPRDRCFLRTPRRFTPSPATRAAQSRRSYWHFCLLKKGSRSLLLPNVGAILPNQPIELALLE